MERRRLEQFEATVPVSPTHLRLIERGIRAKRARIAKLTEEVRAVEDVARADG